MYELRKSAFNLVQQLNNSVFDLLRSEAQSDEVLNGITPHSAVSQAERDATSTVGRIREQAGLRLLDSELIAKT